MENTYIQSVQYSDREMYLDDITDEISVNTSEYDSNVITQENLSFAQTLSGWKLYQVLKKYNVKYIEIGEGTVHINMVNDESMIEEINHLYNTTTRPNEYHPESVDIFFPDRSEYKRIIGELYTVHFTLNPEYDVSKLVTDIDEYEHDTTNMALNTIIEMWDPPGLTAIHSLHTQSGVVPIDTPYYSFYKQVEPFNWFIEAVCSVDGDKDTHISFQIDFDEPITFPRGLSVESTSSNDADYTLYTLRIPSTISTDSRDMIRSMATLSLLSDPRRRYQWDAIRL